LRQWPWPRRYHARLLETIAAAEPRRVFVDVDFSAHTNAEEDGLLEAALEQFEPSQIVLPRSFSRTKALPASWSTHARSKASAPPRRSAA
jgi:CHASE2 domain-containing sensor protein